METALGPQLARAVVLSASLSTIFVACAASNPRVTPGPNRLFGRIIGPDGAPLDGVRITTEPQTDAVLSFEGNYEITRAIRTQQPLLPGTYQLVPYKLGWWRGQDAPPITINYPGEQYRVPDIRLIPIEAPRLDNLAVPEGVATDIDAKGAGVVRGGE